MKSFEEYLKEYFITNCYTGVKEGLESAFEHWISNLDVQEVIDLAEEWGDSIYKLYKDLVKAIEINTEQVNIGKKNGQDEYIPMVRIQYINDEL